MTRRLVFFTTDGGYLIPTIVAAVQVSRQTADGLADVMIFLIDFDEAIREQLQVSFPALHFRQLSASRFALPKAAHFNPTHVPRSALARLVVGDLIDTCYQHLVYLDGDIQIVGDIRPLLGFDVPKGKLLAAPDVAEIIWPEWGAFATGFRSYARLLGIDKPTDYFNSGVLAATRETWIELSREAFMFLSQKSALCRFHDQSALNKVARGRRLALSPRFNMISLLRELDPEAVAVSSILHFTGGEKPWSEDSTASMLGFRSEYVGLVSSYPFLKRLWDQTSGRSPKTTHPPRRVAWRWWLNVWRVGSRRRRRLTDCRTYYLGPIDGRRASFDSGRTSL